VTDREQKSVRKAAKKAAARPGPRADNADCEAVETGNSDVTRLGKGCRQLGHNPVSSLAITAFEDTQVDQTHAR